MSSFSRRSSVQSWATSMCFDCYEKTCRQRNVAMRTAVHVNSRRDFSRSGGTQPSWDSRGRSRHGEAATLNSCSSLPILPHKCRSSLVTHSTTRNLCTSNISLQQHAAIKGAAYFLRSETRNHRTDNEKHRIESLKRNLSHESSIRSILKRWQPLEGSVNSLPAEPGIDPDSRVANNLTRPEGIESVRQEYDPKKHEFMEGFLKDFNRITEPAEGADAENILLKRGDFVEIQASLNTPLLAVYLGLSSNKFFQFYTIFGRLYSSDNRSCAFQIPSYFKPEELDPIMPYVPETTDILVDIDVVIPRNISGPILEKMVDFRKKYEAMYRKYSSAIDDVFDNVALPTLSKHVVLEDLVAIITGQPNNPDKPFLPELVYAVSNALTKDRFGFMIERRTYAASRHLVVLSKEDKRVLDRVQRYVRAYQEESALVAGGFEVPSQTGAHAAILKHFVRKSLKLISESRTLRRSSPELGIISCNKGGLSGNTPEVIHSLEFSDKDRDIIRVLKLQAAADALFHSPTYRSLPSMILRAVGAYEENELREDITWTFLCEIGAVQPYTRTEAFDHSVWSRNPLLDNELERANQRIVGGEALVDVLPIVDSMSGFRRDWDDLPVWCIDSADTVEVDDGISLENIPDEPDNHWIHVHVAHVSAFTSPGHLLGRVAESRLQTLYTILGRSPMLPEWAATEYSLAPNRACLTFSSKVNSEGELLEYKIQPGRIHNVIYTTPETIDFALGVTQKPKEYLNLQCGPPEAPREVQTQAFQRTTEFTQSQKAELQALIALSNAMRERRSQSPVYGFREIVSVVIGHNPGPSALCNMHSEPTHAQFHLRDPSITIRVDKNWDQNLGTSKSGSGDELVEQCMLLTNVIAAKYAAERNLPVIYNGTRPATDDLAPITEATRGELLKGSWNRNVMGTLMALYAVRILSTHPVEQKVMGVSEYAKATSPLRRQQDLVTNWQIDAALREEFRTGKSLVGKLDGEEDWLPYQRKTLDRLLRIWNSRGQNIQWYCGGDAKHWLTQAVARSFYLHDGAGEGFEIPKPLHCTLTRVKMNGTTGVLRELEFPVLISKQLPPDGTEPKEEEVWEVEITKVVPFTRQIIVDLVKRKEGLENER